MLQQVKEQYLVYRVRQYRDEGAYAELYDRYADPLFRFVVGKLSHTQEAEDVTADVFLSAWQYLCNPQKQVKNVRALFYTIARRKVVDAYRARSKGQETELDAAAGLASTTNIEHEIGVKTEVQKLYASIKQLKEEYAEALLLRYLDGYSVGDVADILGKSPGSTRVLLHRAKAKLREVIE